MALAASDATVATGDSNSETCTVASVFDKNCNISGDAAVADGRETDGADTRSVANPTGKRTDYLTWDEYFMAIARLSAARSKDPVTQVGACIVNPDKKIVGIGYNGMPIGCSDDALPWGKDAQDVLNSKYTFVCHAELNAILNKNSADVSGCTIYVDLFPCNECAKLIIQSRIQEVVYLSDKDAAKPKSVASRTMLAMAGVSVRRFVANPRRKQVTISLTDPRELELSRHQ